MSGLATHRCPGCGAVSRLEMARPGLSLPFRALSCCMGVLSVVLGFRFLSWSMFGVTLAISLAVNAVVVARFGRLKLVSALPQLGT